MHVLSTPPAFVLSQNQTLRKCLHGTPPPKRQGNRHTKQPRITPGPVEFGFMRTALPRRRKTIPSQPRLTHETTRPKQPDNPADEPSWHRLLGTLLSSQGADAHPSRPFDPSGGNFSILLASLVPVNPLFRAGRRCEIRSERAGRGGRPPRTSSGCGCLGGTDHQERSWCPFLPAGRPDC